MFSSCRRQNEGDERLALKRHLMVNMTNLRAKAKPVEREMSYSHMVARPFFFIYCQGYIWQLDNVVL